MRKSQQQAAQNALKKKIENTTEEKSSESAEESEEESSDADSDSDVKEEEDARAGVGGIADDSDLFTLKKSDHDVIASDSSEVGNAHACVQAHPVCSTISK